MRQEDSMVAKLLEQAYDRMAKLPEHEQEVIAHLIFSKLLELESEEIEISPRLQAMIDKANRNYAEGLTEELDPDNL
jgi:hypothetical protein